MAVLFECKATILFFYRLPVRKENMIREKLKLFMYQKLKIKSDYTYQGVPQGRKKLHCGTPFLMVRNLSDFSFCCNPQHHDYKSKGGHLPQHSAAVRLPEIAGGQPQADTGCGNSADCKADG